MRRLLLAAGTLAGMAALAALSRPASPDLLVLQWARKAELPTPPVAVLIEMGMKDPRPADWPGRAQVRGAKVVHREGYRFRREDKLLEPDGWQAASHRGLRVPPGYPEISKMEGLATVGVVLHLAEVKDGATLTVRRKDGEKAEVPLKDVLTGRPYQLWGGRAVVRLVSTASPVAVGDTEDDFPAACYGPDGTLWVAYTSYTLRDKRRRVEQPLYAQQPRSFRHLYHPEFADQLFVKSYRGGKWSEPVAVTGPKESIARCAIAAAGDGTVWVAYSAYHRGAHNTFVQSLTPRGRPGQEHNLWGGALNPVMCTDQQGTVWLAWQEWSPKTGSATITTRVLRQGEWLLEVSGLHSPQGKVAAHWWHPSLAAGPGDRVMAAHDRFLAGRDGGDYDVHLMPCVGPDVELTLDKLGVATTARFEARPSIAYDPKGRLWIAYEEGPEKWGKDSGALVRKGNPLYSARSVRVVCFQDGQLMRPAAGLPTSQVKNPGGQTDALTVHRQETGTRYAYPQIGIDGKGRVWLTYRQNFGSRYTTHAGSYWLTFARRLDGDRWSDPVEIHHSDGLLDSRPALLPHKSGGLLVVHNTDGRYTEPETVHNHIYMSYVDLPGDPVEPKLVPHDPGKKDPQAVAEARAEAEAVKRIRGYRIEAGGKKYRLLRGDFHRHTEISWDGGGDGSLEDFFRYALDAAALDWIGNTDHDSGAGREYSWWLIQKYTDAYHVPGAFTPLFAYERSVVYPMGHRNCVFAKRGVMTLPRLAAPGPREAVGGVHADDTKMLYRYLHELGGICASHTSATGMGTDWRDNDPEVEPVVEIYQGDRNSYEYPGAPRSGHDPKSGEKPVSIGGWQPRGFINHAFEKGYRLGFQSSSDHWSTHISYCVVLAERHDREAIVDALRKRHSYAATANIILDVRSGNHLMGDDFKTAAAPALQIHVVGTGKLAKVDILRDSEIVATLRPGGTEYRGTWTDPAPRAGTHYYYVRVLQDDGELAWGSPMWITRE
jgi:hypothetical protein